MKNIIKCAVYKNTHEYGDGYWFIPEGFQKEILEILEDDMHNISTCIGIFDFDIEYLNLCTKKHSVYDVEYWDTLTYVS